MKETEREDRIKYTEKFLENVQGQLRACFKLDNKAQPVFERHPEDSRLRVFTINLFLASPRAREIKKVTYRMDDPTFVEPTGYSTDSDNDFKEEITTYGDVEVDVTIEMVDGHKYKQTAWLSNMLENGHRDDMRQTVRAALQRIRVN